MDRRELETLYGTLLLQPPKVLIDMLADMDAAVRAALVLRNKIETANYWIGRGDYPELADMYLDRLPELEKELSTYIKN